MLNRIFSLFLLIFLFLNSYCIANNNDANKPLENGKKNWSFTIGLKSWNAEWLDGQKSYNDKLTYMPALNYRWKNVSIGMSYLLKTDFSGGWAEQDGDREDADIYLSLKLKKYFNISAGFKRLKTSTYEYLTYHDGWDLIEIKKEFSGPAIALGAAIPITKNGFFVHLFASYIDFKLNWTGKFNNSYQGQGYDENSDIKRLSGYTAEVDVGYKFNNLGIIALIGYRIQETDRYRVTFHNNMKRYEYEDSFRGFILSIFYQF